MKKLFAAIMAAAMVLALTPATMAVSHRLSKGDAVIKDDDYYDDVVNTVAPGSTFWVFLEDYETGISTGPKSISFDELEILDSDTGKTVKMLTVEKTASRLKINSDDRGWFAKVTVKSVGASSYPDDGYDIVSLVLEYTYDGSEDSTDINIDAIEYEEADDEFEDDEKMFTFEKDDDVDIDLPDSAGTFSGVARRDFDVIASMNTDAITSILNKYPNADLQFFNGNGASFPVNNGKLTFHADSGDHLYEVGSNNTLTDRSSTWSSSKNAFVVSTTTLGKYIISDTKLSSTGSTTGGSSSSTGSTGSSETEYIGTNPLPTNPPVITNPSTGACA